VPDPSRFKFSLSHGPVKICVEMDRTTAGAGKPVENANQPVRDPSGGDAIQFVSLDVLSISPTTTPRADSGQWSNRAMRLYSRRIGEREGLNLLPASTAGLIALIEHHEHKALPSDRYGVVPTGRKS